MTKWFRSWHGAPTDPKWRTVAKRAKVAPSIVVAIAWALMDRASQASIRGSVEGYDAETLADFMGCEVEDVEAVINALHEKDVLTNDHFSGWEKYQPEREDGSAERARAWRERKKAEANEIERDQTQVNASERDRATEERRVDTEENLSSLRSDSAVETAKPEEGTAKPAKTPRAKPKTQIAEDAQPTEKDRVFATEAGMSASDFRAEWQRFRDHHRAKGSLMADWSAAWRTWVGNFAKFQSNSRPAQIRPAERRHPALAATEELLREINGSFNDNIGLRPDATARGDHANGFAFDAGAGAGRTVQVLDYEPTGSD